MKKDHLLMLFSLFVIISCSKSEDNGSLIENELVVKEVSQEILSKLEKAHFSTANVFLTNYEGKEVVAVEDMFLSVKEIEELAEEYSSSGIVQKHYRTNNLVNVSGSTRTLIVDITGSGLGNLGSRALNQTINEYNRINSKLRFRRLRAGESARDIDIKVTVFAERPNPVTGSIVLGRSEGFPRRGNPAPSFGLNSIAIDLLDIQRFELAQIMAHEIGHAIGFRHTDFATRESCREGGNEGSAGVGAIYIDGSPTGADTTSLMQACSGGNTSTIFNRNDRRAIRKVY